MIIALSRRYLLCALLAAVLAAAAGCTSIQPPLPVAGKPVDSTKEFDYALYQQLLTRFVDDQGLVDYSGLSEEPQGVNQFYGLIAAYSPDSHPDLFIDEDSRLAYWINSYNLTVIKGVLHHYPITSVAEVPPPALLFFFPSKSGFFFFQRFTYGGVETSLYYLENKVIRARFSDPRYHFGLNCASSSCPQLPRVPFYPDTLDEQLDAEAVKFINSAANVSYDEQSKTLYLSAIFDWYEKDFLAWLRDSNRGLGYSIVDYILLYLNEPESGLVRRDLSSLRIEYLPYDWTLNDANRAATGGSGY